MKIQLTPKEMTKIARDHLKDASRDYLQEIVDHGIHNLTNEFNGDCAEDFEIVFKEVARLKLKSRIVFK